MHSKINKLLELRRRLWKKKWLLALFTLFLSALIIYNSDTIMIDTPKKLSKNIYAVSGIDAYSYWSRTTGGIFRFVDDINPFRFKKNLMDGTLPVYDLRLSPNDLRYFDNITSYAIETAVMPKESLNWRSTKLWINGSNQYKVEAKIHGSHYSNWEGNLKAYKIKSDEFQYINGMHSFILILFEEDFDTKIIRDLADIFGLQNIRDDIVVLRINGVVQGLYYLQERLDSAFLENNKCSNCYIVSISDTRIQDHPYSFRSQHYSDPNGINWEAGHITPFAYDIANLNVDEIIPDSKELVNYRINELYDAIKRDDLGVINYFDIDYLSSFEAFRAIHGNSHLVAGDNLQMIYKATDGKVYPIANGENIGQLQLERGGFERSLNTFKGRTIQLFYLLGKNDELRQLRNKKLYSFITNNTLLGDYDQYVKKYLPYALSYKTNKRDTRHFRHLYKEQRDNLRGNMDLIKRNLEYSKAYINVIEKDNKIIFDVIPDAISGIKFSELKIDLAGGYSGNIDFKYILGNTSSSYNVQIADKTNSINLTSFVEKFYFSAGLDKDLYPEKRTYHLEATFNESNKVLIKKLEIRMKNDVTGMELPDHDIYVQTANGNTYYELPRQFLFEEFKNKYPSFNWRYDDKEHQLTLLEGDYVLDNDVVIPKLNALNIEKGTKISIAKDKAFISYSPMNIMGVKEEPVIIKALDKSKPFGTFAVVGDDAKSNKKTIINWLDLSGGSETWINGIYFSGQFAIYNMDAVLNNTSVHGSHSDDGLIVKYSNIVIDNSNFFENNADQADFDFVTGIVKNSDFNGFGDGDINGDGIDLSGSRILLKNNKFYNSPDKGVSIGEEAIATLYNNKINYNNIGVAVKDSSQAYFIANTFKKNKIAISSYKKKPLFGGGTSYLYKNLQVFNDNDFSNDKESMAYELNLTDKQYEDLAKELENDIQK